MHSSAQPVDSCNLRRSPARHHGNPLPPAAQSGLSENTAACLSYVLGWLTGIIFFLIDKRPYVRFHAAQSIVTFGGLHIIRIVLAMVFGMGFFFGGYHGYGHYGYAGWGSLGLGIAMLGIAWIADVCPLDRLHDQGGEPDSVLFCPLADLIAQNLAGM